MTRRASSPFTTSSKRKTRETWAHGSIKWVPCDKAYREGTVTGCFLCSVFIAKARLQESLSMEARVKVWEKEGFLLVKKDQIRYPLVKLDIQKSTDPDEMHP